VKINLLRPTDEELATLGVAWITPAMDNYSPSPLDEVEKLNAKSKQ
jgi:hypothetical protein